MLKINIEVEDSTITMQFNNEEPICPNDEALAIAQIEKFKMMLLEIYDGFERTFSIEENK